MSAFDTLAPSYDDDFTHQPIGKILRSKIHHRLLTNFSAGEHVLEIGCGTGEDALFLGDNGIYVTATDYSDSMLDIATQKCANQPNVSVEVFDISLLTSEFTKVYRETAMSEPNAHSFFDGIFSNFGALNCIDDWKPLAEDLSVLLKSGGKACFGIMSPYCVWEFLWHAGHWKWDIALRRLRGDTFDGLTISYPTVKRITEDFAPYFRRVHLQPLGLFLPTSALFDVVQKRPKLMKTLVNLEERFDSVAPLSQFADHYWIEFERV